MKSNTTKYAAAGIVMLGFGILTYYAGANGGPEAYSLTFTDKKEVSFTPAQWSHVQYMLKKNPKADRETLIKTMHKNFGAWAVIPHQKPVLR